VQNTSYEQQRLMSAQRTLMTTMMDVPLRVTDIIDRAERYFGEREVMSRVSAGELQSMTYAELGARARRLAAGLKALGIRPGARVATLMSNHATHVAAYFAIPGIEAVMHTLNPRFTPEQVAYTIADAGDEAALVDESLLPLWSEVERFVSLPHVIVNGDSSLHPRLSDLLAHEPLSEWPCGPLDERTAVSICHTSGTTGQPKAVVYSHRSIVLHALITSLPDGLDLSGNDVLFTLTPMCHVNGWGLPFAAAMVGAKHILPGAQISAEEILDIVVRERVTKAFGIPTFWVDLLQAMDAHPGRWRLPETLRLFTGGAAPSRELMRRFDRFGVVLRNGWGMTETSPIATQAWLKREYHEASYDRQIEVRISNGLPLPLVELRIADDQGRTLPRDGQARGELQARGPSIAGGYLGHPQHVSACTPDGWLKTGDVAVIHPDGYLRLVDRLKDLIKSGGEWISSVDMENALLDHPAISEAAVIAVPDERWGERPMVIAVLRPGCTLTAEELRAHLSPHYPKWALPDRIEFAEQLPRTSVGKTNKAALRERLGAA
jgi:fatty-acyl-CoA synthase